MERVEEARIIRKYVDDYPTIKFRDLANIIVTNHPDISIVGLQERIARIVYNDYYAPDSSSTTTSNQSG